MGMTWNGDAAFAAIMQEASRRLLAAAKILQNEHRIRLSVANPPPHRSPAPKGTYPKLRSGRLRAGTIHEPQTIAEIITLERIRVGYSKVVPYGAHLYKGGWKGIQDTAKDIQPQMAAVLVQGQTVTV